MTEAAGVTLMLRLTDEAGARDLAAARIYVPRGISFRIACMHALEAGGRALKAILPEAIKASGFR